MVLNGMLSSILHKFSHGVRGIYHLLESVVKGFINDDCYEKASALAYYSLLSVVPILAVLFAIAKGFGLENALEAEISNHFLEQPEIKQKLVQFAYSLLQNVKAGFIAGIGTVLLLWSVVSLLNSLESALNAVWKVKEGRPIGRKISDYLSFCFVAPLFLIVSSGINVYLILQVKETAQNYAIVGAVSPFIIFVLKLFPFFLTWILFIFIYAFMPNTKVFLRHAVIAGIIAGTLFQIWQGIYIHFQIGASNYGAIYGSFAAIPLFLIWLQASWLILLFGAEIAAKIDQASFIFSNKKSHLISIKTAALGILTPILLAFRNGSTPLTDVELAHQFGMTLSDVQSILEMLTGKGVLAKIANGNKTFAYQPAKPIDSITPVLIFDALDKSNEITAHVQQTEVFHKIEKLMNTIHKRASDSIESKPLISLIP